MQRNPMHALSMSWCVVRVHTPTSNNGIIAANGGSHLVYAECIPLKAAGCVHNGQLYPISTRYNLVRSCCHL